MHHGREELTLSVVATTRNDNHGGTLTYRTQHFIDGFVSQCKKHALKAELILVEWNPPADRPPLSRELQFPSEKGPCSIRIIRVPREVHETLAHSDRIPLFQMIGKNVGIRRARGKFILATNIDILFSDAIMSYLKENLKPGFLYRADRLDVPAELPSGRPFDEILAFCSAQFFRINGKFGTRVKGEARAAKWLSRMTRITPRKTYDFLKKFPGKLARRLKHNLHTNACGDFTLMSAEDWEKLRGYPEWNIFSWHLDSVLLYQAKKNGIKEIDLPRKMAIYHIEHGSGYTPEGADALFKRLETKGIPYLENEKLFALINGREKVYNRADWGAAGLELEERDC